MPPSIHPVDLIATLRNKHLTPAIVFLTSRRACDEAMQTFEHSQIVLPTVRQDRIREVLASLIAAAPDLLVDLSSSVKTDLTLDEMQRLAVLVQEIDRDKIKSEVLDQRYTEFATTPDGSQVIIPLRARIAELRETFFSTTANGAVERSVGLNPTPVSP